jgi:hypothetical protein
MPTSSQASCRMLPRPLGSRSPSTARPRTPPTTRATNRHLGSPSRPSIGSVRPCPVSSLAVTRSLTGCQHSINFLGCAESGPDQIVSARFTKVLGSHRAIVRSREMFWVCPLRGLPREAVPDTSDHSPARHTPPVPAAESGPFDGTTTYGTNYHAHQLEPRAAAAPPAAPAQKRFDATTSYHDQFTAHQLDTRCGILRLCYWCGSLLRRDDVVPRPLHRPPARPLVRPVSCSCFFLHCFKTLHCTTTISLRTSSTPGAFDMLQNGFCVPRTGCW